MTKIERISRVICKYYGYDSDKLEPGDYPRKDGICSNGDPGHFIWRQYAPLANKIIEDLDKSE